MVTSIMQWARTIPMWLLLAAVVLVSSGAAIGVVLSGTVTGEIPVTVSQALLVANPVNAGVTLTEGRKVPQNVIDGCGGDPVSHTVSIPAAKRFIGVVGDDHTSFQASAEVSTGDCFTINLPLKNASNLGLVGSITLSVPDGITAEVVSAASHITTVARTSANTWGFILAKGALYDPANDCLLVVLAVDDRAVPGFYTVTGTLRQVQGSTNGDPSISVTKSGPANIGVGSTATYTITVKNNGDVALTNVALTDLVPSGMSYLASVPPGTSSGSQVTWNLGLLGIGQIRTVSLVLSGDSVGSWTDRATADCDQGVTSTASATTGVIVPSLAVTVVDTIDPVAVGSQTKYVVTVTNEGSVAAHNIRIEGTLDVKEGFVSAIASPAVPFSVAGQVVTFDPVAVLNAGASTTYSITVTALAAGSAVCEFEVTFAEFGVPVPVEEGTTLF